MARSIAKIDRDTKAAHTAAPKPAPFFSKKEVANADIVINKGGEYQEAQATWHADLRRKGVVPTALSGKDGVPRLAAITEILIPRIIREFDAPFAAKLYGDQALSDKAILEFNGDERPRGKWRNSLISARMALLTKGYGKFLAEEGLMESGGELVKLQGNNAGTPKATDGTVWSNTEARIAFNFATKRLGQLAKKALDKEKGGLDKTDLAFRRCYEEVKIIAEPFRGTAKS